jgi:hypothetical protein
MKMREPADAGRGTHIENSHHIRGRLIARYRISRRHLPQSRLSIISGKTGNEHVHQAEQQTKEPNIRSSQRGKS